MEARGARDWTDQGRGLARLAHFLPVPSSLYPYVTMLTARAHESDEHINVLASTCQAQILAEALLGRNSDDLARQESRGEERVGVCIDGDREGCI